MTLLLLSNNYLIHKVLAVSDKTSHEIPITHIITASRGVENLDYLDEARQKLDELSVSYDDIDIEGKKSNDIPSILQGYDIIFVSVGNPFY